MTDINMNQTPDELLAQKILDDVRAKKLLTVNQLDELPKKLTSGRMKKEDWQIMVEKAVDAEGKGKDAKTN